MADTKKSKPKAPPKSPVRSIRSLSDAKFKELQNKVNSLTKTKGPIAVAKLFKSFNEGSKDRKTYYKNVDTAEQLIPMVKAEAERRKKAKTKMRGGGMAMGKAKMAKKKMRGGGMAKRRMAGGGMAKMAKKKMMGGGMAKMSKKKKMMRGGMAKKKK